MIIPTTTNNNNNNNNSTINSNNNSLISNSNLFLSNNNNNININNINKSMDNNNNNNNNNNIYYKYVDSSKLKDEYECCICFHACENPVIEPKCQQMFCSDCLKSSLEKSNNHCPFCNMETSSSSLMLPPKFITNRLNELKVTCTLCDENGSTPMNRKDFKNHLDNECKCTCSGPCGQKILRKDLASHVCPFVDLRYLTSGVGNHVLSKSGRWLNTPQVISCLLESTNEKFSLPQHLIAKADMVPHPQQLEKHVIIEKEVSPPTVTQFNYNGRDVFVFNALHDLDEIPPFFTSIAFTPNSNRSMFYLTSHLPSICTELFLLDGFDQKVCPEDIPSHIETLHVYNIKYPLVAESIPSTVKSVHLHHGYAHPIEQGIIPEGVEEVHVHNTVYPITKTTLPSTVRKVSFNSGYSHPIRPGTISKMVSTIHIGDIKEPLIPNSIPFNSKQAPSRKLYIHGGYKHPFKAGVIPLVESLFIGETRRPILSGSIPNGTQNIHFGQDYAHGIQAEAIPTQHLKSLQLSNLGLVNHEHFSNLKFNELSHLHYNLNPLKHKFNNIKLCFIPKSVLDTQFSI